MNKVIKRRFFAQDSSAAKFPDTIPKVLQNVYMSRGVKSAEELDYSLGSLQRPELFKGLDTAAALLVEAVTQGSKICIVGDFDVDGATSTALCIRCFRAFGHHNIDYIVPNRFEYGYGLSPEIVDVVAALEPEYLITVDNGISSIEGVAAAKAKGMTVIVTDHHLPGRQLPQADAIVNPNQPNCGFESKNLAGVGVIFYVLNTLRAGLREVGWFETQGIEEPNMGAYLDLVALGTVADVVPLDFNNRILVSQGMRRMQSGKCCAGIKALMDVGGRSMARLATSDLGFIVGPRLNAAGRLDDMRLGIQCLLAESEAEAYPLARELDLLNRDRKSIEQGMKQEAYQLLDALSLEQGQSAELYGISLFKPGWHQGVVGILASRIKERLHRPTIVFAEEESGQLKGSGRSIPGVHLRDVLDEVATRHPGLLTKFGGHAMAAGLSIAEDAFTEFSVAFNEAVERFANEETLEAVLWSDGVLEESDFTIALAKCIRQSGPWGQHFPEPAFEGVFRLVQQRIVGQKHLKVVLAPRDHSSVLVDGIMFNCDVNVWPDENVQFVRLVYKLDVNEYRGSELLQLLVDYIAPVSEQDWREQV